MIPLDEILSGLHPRYQTAKLKARLLKENVKSGDCERCGLPPVWNGEKLTMQLDHKDGDCSNHLLANLWIICPNCHSQTDTYGGRNKKIKKHAPSQVELEHTLGKAHTINEALYMLGMNRSRKNFDLLRNAVSQMQVEGKACAVVDFRKPHSQHRVRPEQVALAQKVRNADIDFTKTGWVTKVAVLVGKHPQKIYSWMKRYLPDITERAVHRRGTDKSTPL